MKEKTNFTVGIVGAYSDFKTQSMHKRALASAAMRRLFENLIETRNTKHFFCAPDAGLGLLACEVLLSLKRKYPFLKVSCVIPDERQAVDWKERTRDRYFRAIEASDSEFLLRTSPDPDPYGLVFDFMESHSDLVFAIDAPLLVCSSSNTIRNMPVA